MSKPEQILEWMIKAEGLPAAVREYRFAAEHVGAGRGVRARLKAAGLRDWRFDFAWPGRRLAGGWRLAVEVEGGGWSGGRHTSGSGFAMDLRKYAAAVELGWIVIRVDPAMVNKGRATKMVRKLLDAGG